MGEKDNYVGEEPQSRRRIQVLVYPFEQGVITNFDCVEKIWHHSFYNELRVAPEEHPVLFTDSILNPPENREKITQILFETFSVPCFYMNCPAIFNTFACGATSGLSIDCGYDSCQIVPVFEGHAVQGKNLTLPFGGKQLTQYFINLLSKNLNYSFVTSAEIEIARDIKEKHVLCAKSSAELDNIYKEINYELPDGTVITIGNDRVKCSEILFNPSLVDETITSGIHEMCFAALSQIEVSIRKIICEQLVLAGGTSLIPGLHERLTSELAQLMPLAPNIVAKPEVRCKIV